MLKHIGKSFRTQRQKDIPTLIHELYNHFKQISQDDDDENNELNFEEMIGIHLDTSALKCLFTCGQLDGASSIHAHPCINFHKTQATHV